jgi:hypothetical protein
MLLPSTFVFCLSIPQRLQRSRYFATPPPGPVGSLGVVWFVPVGGTLLGGSAAFSPSPQPADMSREAKISVRRKRMEDTEKLLVLKQ